MNDVYELEEFMETPGGKGFVMTRKCPADQYVNTPEGDRELVNAS